MCVVLADVVWPALFLVDRLSAWWCVGTGLFIEFLILRWALKLPATRILLITIGMNGVSSMVGWFILQWWGWNWEWVVEARNASHGYGTFNWITWAETCVVACCLNTLIEWCCLEGSLMGLRRPSVKSTIGWLLLANGLTVGMAFGSLLLSWPRN